MLHMPCGQDLHVMTRLGGTHACKTLTWVVYSARAKVQDLKRRLQDNAVEEVEPTAASCD